MDTQTEWEPARTFDFAKTAARRVQLLESLAPIAVELQHLAHLESAERSRLGDSHRYTPSVADIGAQRFLDFVDGLSLASFRRR